MFVCLCVHSHIAPEATYRFAPNLAWLFLETRKRIQQDKNRGKVSWGRFPTMVVPVPRKLRTTQEQRQDKSCLFRKGDCRNKDHKPKNNPEFDSQLSGAFSFQELYDIKLSWKIPYSWIYFKHRRQETSFKSQSGTAPTLIQVVHGFTQSLNTNTAYPSRSPQIIPAYFIRCFITSVTDETP
jgi:hypothetical protein